MSRNYKNIIKYKSPKTGKGRREEIAMMPLENSTFQIDTLLLEDYDQAFKYWADKELSVVFEKEELPTVALFASQRFGEYMQSWQHSDNKKNFLMNFKVITRENNPKPGTMYGNLKNIPEDKFYLIQRIETIDENGRPLYKDYKMKQPYCVDITYHLSIVTNKFRLLNKFNELLNEQFKCFEKYINVKGHYVSMYLDDISDESEYMIDDRQYFSQSYNITLKGYIIREEDVIVEESPKMKYSCLEGSLSGNKRSYAEIEDMPECWIDKIEYKGLKITITLDKCSNYYEFTVDEAMIVNKMEVDNSKHFRMTKNGEKVLEFNLLEPSYDIDLRVIPGDVIRIDQDVKINLTKGSTTIVLSGYNPLEIIEK